jgi:hypothetical protein
MTNVAIDHGVAGHLVDQMEQHSDAINQTWQSSRAAFEDLKAAGAMLGQASDACQLAVQRTSEHQAQLHQQEKALFENIRNAHTDDLRVEEESASMFHGLGTH